MNIRKFLTKKYLLTGVAVIVLIIVIFKISGNGNGQEIIEVKKADVVKTITVTGKTKAQNDVNLGFDKTGRVIRSFAQVGDRVKEGDIVAELDSSDILADLLKARAILDEELINLGETKENSSSQYDDAVKNASSKIKDAFVKSDDAVRNKTDQFFKSPTTNPNFEVSFDDGNYTHYFSVPTDVAININSKRQKLEEILKKWKMSSFSINQNNVNSILEKSISYTQEVSSFLNDISKAVNSFSTPNFTYETTVSGYKSDISTARVNVTTALSSLISAKEKLTSAPTNTSIVSQFDSVLVQKSKVSQARATVSSLEAILNKSIIRSPFDGIVTKQDAKEGSIISAGEEVVSIISENDMYIEANISEINIGRVAIGNSTEIEFDAFPDEIISGQITYVEPGETIVDGVVNYKSRISFNTTQFDTKSGLSANVDIEVSRKNNVIVVPSYAVYKNESGNFVKKIDGKNIIEIPVKVGLSGSNGSVEIISGLLEGDKIIFSKE